MEVFILIKDIYLVDCENRPGIKVDSDPNTSLVFYYTHNKRYKLKLAPNEVLEILYHDHSKDATDKIIDSYLGYYICKYGKNVHYHVISNDKGFSPVIAYWTRQGYAVTNMAASGCVLQLKGFNPSDRDLKHIRNIYRCWQIAGEENVGELADLLHASLKKKLGYAHCEQLAYMLVSKGGF